MRASLDEEATMPPPEHPDTVTEQADKEPGSSPKDWHDFTSESTFDVAPLPVPGTFHYDPTFQQRRALGALFLMIACLYVGLILVIVVFHDSFGLSAVLASWIAFILALIALAGLVTL